MTRQSKPNYPPRLRVKNAMEKVVSEFRFLFWLKKVFVSVFLLVATAYCLYLWASSAIPDYSRIFLIAAIGAFVLFIFHSIHFLMVQLKRITVSDEGIHIRYLVGGRRTCIKREEIRRFNRSGSKLDANTEWNYSLEIELNDTRVIYFDEMEIENFEQLKVAMYEYMRN